ncbi:MAG TPA: vWA domain-containing protein [Vicinamibacteria bacterium]|nr:vWA domain-containing protein [Vicinamibacteria bacterium]
MMRMLPGTLALSTLLAAQAPAPAETLIASTPNVGVPPSQSPRTTAPRPGPALAAARPRVEVTFVLDTTGSMGGLIEGAKRRIWSVARRIGEGQPRPDLRIALVAYRDRGDQYVTQVHDFTGDMDALYARLMSFQADGGGDTPEHVSAALDDAVHRVSWSREPGLKVVFLVGDAPPHMDYQDGYDYRRAVQAARQKGIAIETIQCGGDPQTAAVWQEIASLGDGHYARIDQNGGMPAQVTPVDAELARLNRELASTVVAGGSEAERAKTRDRMAARIAMAPPAAAEAAGYFAKAESLASHDLVSLPEAAQRQELKDKNASPELAGKSDADALAYLKAQKEKRAQIQGRIDKLAKERDAQLAAGAKDAFDEKVVQALKERAAAQGVKY